MQNKANLLNTQMNVTSFYRVDYENKSNWKLGQNKANTKPIQSQNKPNFRKAKMKLTFYPTKDYENQPRLRTPPKQTQSNPILFILLGYMLPSACLMYQFTAITAPLVTGQPGKLSSRTELKQLTKLTAGAVSACAVVQYSNPAQRKIVFYGVGRLDFSKIFRYFHRC